MSCEDIVVSDVSVSESVRAEPGGVEGRFLAKSCLFRIHKLGRSASVYDCTAAQYHRGAWSPGQVDYCYGGYGGDRMRKSTDNFETK